MLRGGGGGGGGCCTHKLFTARIIFIIILFYFFKVKDLRERVEEAESLGVRKMKAQLSAMENRLKSLEEQLDVTTR